MDGIRINKYLSEHGICSRREADRLLAEGKILVNGIPAAVGQRILPGDTVEADGKEIREEERDKAVILAFHKPRGVVCTSSDRDRAPNIIDYIAYPARIYPVGRLDKDSTGLILLTNIGEISDRISRARGHHEKEYIVRCRKRVTDVFLKRMAEGVRIEVPDAKSGSGEKNMRSVITRKCRVGRVNEDTFRIILTQGYNRQIRRMCRALGNEVEDLKRIRIMNIELGTLPEGRYRLLTPEETEKLVQLLKAAEGNERKKNEVNYPGEL